MKICLRSFVFFLAASVFLSGCGASISTRWRDDAAARFNTALAAGVETFAPEETDNIRQTMNLADRYYKSEMFEDSERLYQLSTQKSQLLYRNLVVSKIRQGATVAVEQEKGGAERELLVADAPVSLKQALEDDNDDDTMDDEERLAAPGAEKLQLEAVLPSKEQPLAGASRLPGSENTPPSSLPKVSKQPLNPRASKTPATHNVSAKNGQQPLQSRGGTTLYLTFDDGPSRLTVPIASYLASQGVKATFFALGSNIKGREKTLSSVLTMGHRVGNHTLSHNLRKLNASFKNSGNEVRKTAAMIDRLGGDGKLVRIPYGASNKTIASNVAAEGAQIFDWDINSNDSTRQGAKSHQIIERTVLNRLRSTKKRHLIILFHDGSGHDATLTAIKSLIPRLKQEGYGFGLLARNETVALSAASSKKGVP